MTPRIPEEESESIEARLRAAAPVPPSELRAQILNRCRQERRPAPRLPWYRSWSLTGAFAALVLFCWLASGRLDAQNQALLTGKSARSFDSAAALRSDQERFVLALQWRLRQLALLLHDRHSG